ncbi:MULTISPECIES: hypothetical protein [Haloferax]|uniref:Uncharacterized protein n=2 Tax=Haloferax TaxID=2251 RepID=A0ACD5HUZ5_9EURY|nr:MULTISPECIES: hypothetical protein [Haloferax]ELZ75358.1 hypothetical protein C456_06807 [Haloferax lucentense DSM 14919]RDZ31147.1 hypothetical protein DEQ67_06965 [Haloferax sp. Atlit-48N]RDZ35292.1 hypothetical protein C5B88_12870 [Haloferax sp. Atlit-24N]RLM35702.1 hypothetical protein DVK03_12880 [Haloferax sp. Atlit-109R]RLM43551.1 hypothetical protein DVK04_12880 [Haloferax sp. Atlit-105R]
MASATRDGDPNGVEFVREDDGSITAYDTETNLARDGDTRAEALSQLAEVLVLHEGGGEPLTDDDLEELGLNSDEFENRGLPDFTQ